MARKGGWQEFSSTGGAGASGLPALARSAGDAASTAAVPRAQQVVRVQRTKAGKGGKTVTLIRGLILPDEESRSLLKTLKARAGTGGTIKEGVIELQGDQVAAALEALTQQGFRPKQAGG